MSIWQKIGQKVKSWLGGGSSKKSTPPTPRGGKRYTYTRQSSQSVGGYRGSRARSYNDEEEKKKKKKQTSTIQKRPAFEAKSMADAIKNSSSSNKGVALYNYGAEKAKEKSVIERKAEIDANREKAKKRLDALKSTAPKHNEQKQTANTGGYTSKERKQVRRELVKNNPKAAGAIGGVASALSWGATDLLGSVHGGDKYYKKYRDKTAEDIASGVASLATFGGAGKVAERYVTKKLATKGGQKVVAKVAGNKLVRKSAEKAVDKAIRKGTIKAGSEALVKEVAKDKAKRLVSNVAENALIDTTAGAVYDFNKATARHKIGSDEWKKEMRDNAFINVGAGAIGIGVGNIKRNKTLINEAKSALNALGESKSSKNYLRGRLKDSTMRVKRGSKWRAKDRIFNGARRAEDALDRQAVLGDAYGDISKGILPKNEIDTGRLPRKVAPIRNIDNAERIEPHKATALRVISNATEKASPNVRAKLDDLVKVSNKAEARIKEIDDELKRVSDGISKARGVDPKREEELIQRFDDLMTERNSLEYSQRSANATKSVAEEPPKRKPTKTEKARDELRKERQALQEEYEAAKAAGEDTSGVLSDMQEVDMSLKELDRKIAKADKARTTRATNKAKKATANEQLNLVDEVSDGSKARKAEAEQETLADKISASEANPASKTVKTELPKTAKQKKNAEAAERSYLDTVMRKREKNLNKTVRSETKGEYGYRQGEHTAAAHSSLEHAKRIDAEQKKVGKILHDDGVAELFENTDNTFGVFKTANRAELDKAAGEAVKRVNDDTHGTIKRLRDLDERLKADVKKNSALSSAEHITLNDVADIIAVRNLFDEAGETLPKEYEEAFAHIIEWQRTEAAQGLKAIDLFLKENDASYRRAFLTRDIDRYMRKVLHADDVGIEDIKRSLDANHGEGYYDKMLEELSKYTGAKNEAAFRKAYADFQAEIFMNTKPSVWDAINLWRHSFMLSSPKTGANNIIGNVMQRVMYRISDAVNMAGESIAQGINPEVKRTTALLKSSDQRKLARMYTSGRRGKLNLKNENYLKGFDDQAFADEINMVSDVDVAEMMASSKYMGDIVKGLKYKPTTAGGKVKQGLIKGGRWGNEYVSLMLNEPDSWFVERNYRSALLKYLEANGVNGSKSLNTKEGAELLREARAYAKDVALENTYKKANKVVSFLEGLRTKGHSKGSGVGYKIGSIVLDAELPYLKVPANLIINNFKYSPMGLAKGALDAFKGITKGDAELLNMATRELSKGLTGTGMAMLGYMMFCRDQTDDDSWGFIANARDELKEYGVRDNSFKIGDHNFNIANMGIGSVQFLMGASLAEDLAENGETAPYQVVFDALNKTVDTVADMSLMENAVSLLDAFGNGGDYDATVSERLGRAGTEIAGDYAAQFIPNPLRGVAKGITSADLDTGVKKGETTKIQRILERNKNNFVQGVPIANEKMLPHKVDTHGNLVNERKTNKDKLKAVLNNTLNPLSPREVNIPEADKEELKVIKEKSGEPFKPKGFDKDREYKVSVGSGGNKVDVNLTGKEREQVARSAKHSGYDGAESVVKKGMFGDRLGERAQTFLQNVPDDEEKAREYLFSTPEWKNSSNEEKEKWLNAWYGEGTGNKYKGTTRGVTRTRNEEAFVNVAGNSEGDFRWQNDISSDYQKKYIDNNLEDLGIDKGTYADAVQAVYDYSHKWDEENQKNVDTPNSAKKVKAALLSVEGLTPEQRVAIYQSYRGKRNGFGWYDWDGVSGGSGYRGRGYRRYRRYRRRGGGSSKVSMSTAMSTKMPKVKYESMTTALPKSASTKSTTRYKTASAKATKHKKLAPKTKVTATAKIAPPNVKFKKYEV